MSPEYLRTLEKGIRPGRCSHQYAEGSFLIFKRCLVGTYRHIESQHLPRYLAEFDFRMNTRKKLGINNTMRAEIALQGMRGKRLIYR